MRATIDGAGRLVVPKALRDLLGLRAGQALDMAVHDGRLVVEPAPTSMHLQEGPVGVRAVPDEPLPALTVDEVRATLEQTRR